MFQMLKKKNIFCICVKTHLKVWKTSYSFNDLHYITVKKLSALLGGITLKHT